MQEIYTIWTVLDVRRLKILQELDRHQTVGAAAAALHLTPSAVSQQLAALGREVGCPVIEKDGRNVRLTGAARVLLDHACDLFAQLERLEADLQHHRGGEVGRVRVAAFQTAAQKIVVPAARALAGTHPRLEVDLHQMDAPRSYAEVEAGRIDIAVSVEYADSPPSTSPRFARMPLLRDEFRALLPASHRLAGHAEVELVDLADEPWIGSLPGSPCHNVTMAACAAAGFSPRLRHHIDDWAITIEMVAAGLGIGLIPSLASPPPRQDVVIRPLKDRPAARNIFAATRRGLEEYPTIGAVLAAMAEAGGPGLRDHRTLTLSGPPDHTAPPSWEA